MNGDDVNRYRFSDMNYRRVIGRTSERLRHPRHESGTFIDWETFTRSFFRLALPRENIGHVSELERMYWVGARNKWVADLNDYFWDHGYDMFLEVVYVQNSGTRGVRLFKGSLARNRMLSKHLERLLARVMCNDRRLESAIDNQAYPDVRALESFRDRCLDAVVLLQRDFGRSRIMGRDLRSLLVDLIDNYLVPDEEEEE